MTRGVWRRCSRAAIAATTGRWCRRRRWRRGTRLAFVGVCPWCCRRTVADSCNHLGLIRWGCAAGGFRLLARPDRAQHQPLMWCSCGGLRGADPDHDETFRGGFSGGWASADGPNETGMPCGAHDAAPRIRMVGFGEAVFGGHFVAGELSPCGGGPFDRRPRVFPPQRVDFRGRGVRALVDGRSRRHLRE